jgi:hypothetical protein
MKWLGTKPEFALTIPLGIVCAVLALALVVESYFFPRSGVRVGPPASVSGEEKPPGDLEPEDVFELPQVDEFSAFVDRPLFVEGRKPPPPESEQPQANQQQETSPLTLLLMGVMLSPRGEMAILAEPTGKNRRVKKGGTISGWRLVEIKPDRATLQRGEERKELVLLKPRPKLAGPATASGPGRPGVPPAAGARRGAQPPPEVNEPDVEELEEPEDSADSGASDVEE